MSLFPVRSLSDDEQAALPPARPGQRLALVLASLVLLASFSATVARAYSGAAASVRPTQELVALLTAHEVFAKPTLTSARFGRVEATRPLTGAGTVLPVVGHRTGSDGLEWLQVRVPGRPNGRTGWIRRRGTAGSKTRWHIVVDTSLRRVSVFESGRRARTFKAVVGTPSTPTPHGSFFVEEAIQLRASDVGAPFALALSARSNVLQQFAGGPGQIGLHGLANVGGTLGTAASHGCVRLDNDAMRWLVLRIGPGVPVTITG